MDKEKEIKRISSLIDDNVSAEAKADRLLEAGYGNVKEAVEELAEAKELCRKKVGDLKINEWIKIMTLAGYEVKATSWQEKFEEVRKETAKEILAYVGNLYEDGDDLFQMKDYQWYKNLCKKYGVEVEV